MARGITKTEDGKYRVEDYTYSGYIDRTTEGAEQCFVTYWRVDEATNEFSLEKALFGWRTRDEDQMFDETAQFLHPEAFYFPTKEEKRRPNLEKTSSKPTISGHYFMVRKAIHRHRKQLMLHLKLIEPPVEKSKVKFIVVPYRGMDARIEHAVETERMIGTYRKSNVSWVHWSPEKEHWMHAYNAALKELKSIQHTLFYKEEN